MERGALHAEDDVLFTVDSRHVKGLIDEKFTARENRVLATLLSHMWKVDKTKPTTPHPLGTWSLGRWEMALQTAWQTRAHAGYFLE